MPPLIALPSMPSPTLAPTCLCVCTDIRISADISGYGRIKDMKNPLIRIYPLYIRGYPDMGFWKIRALEAEQESIVTSAATVSSNFFKASADFSTPDQSFHCDELSRNTQLGNYLAPDLALLRQFSPNVLSNCAKLRVVHSVDISDFPKFPAYDSVGASSGQALAKWLYTPRGDGLPKVLQCFYCLTGVQRVKEQFLTSTVPANFINCLLHGTYCSYRETFELRNNLMGEQLCPTERDDAKWAKWEQEAVEWDWRRLENRVFIHCINDRDIGDDRLLYANEVFE
uniref:Uncharacterized protein n=1 Tax=Globodera rostochiensis TaxID=31243 RepID=A0A914H6J1_GLORO